MTTIFDVLKRQLEFTNAAEYHRQGYTGKDIVMLNTESQYDSHGIMTNGVIEDFAPDTIILNGCIGAKSRGDILEYCHVTIKGVTYDFEEAIKKFNIKITTTSLAGSTSKLLLKYFRDMQSKYGLIMFNSAGNDGTDGTSGKYVSENTAIAVGAAVIKEDGTVDVTHYSSRGDEVDFIAPLGKGSGTSAASPTLAAMTALLLQRFGDFNQIECVEILKSVCIDLGDPGDDIKYGWGLPILPMTDKLEILEKLRGVEKMQFKDVEDTRWSKAAIDRCVEEGLLLGFEDGTFRPTETVTREQFATILTRILDKIEGRI